MNSNTVALLVVNYFSSQHVGELLQSIPRPGSDTRVVVSVFDNSVDAAEFERLQSVVDEVDEGFAAVVVTASVANLGYAGGNNAALVQLRHESPEIVVVCNPDVRWVSGNWSNLVGSVLEHSRSIIGFTTVDNGMYSSGLGRLSFISGRSKQVRDVRAGMPVSAYAAGHFFAVTTVLWDQLGGLSDRYFLYCEEVDLALRAKKRGISVVGSGAVQVGHIGGATTDSVVAKSPTTVFHSNRSRVILYKNHTKLRPFLVTMVPIRFGMAAAYLITGRPRLAAETLNGLRAGFRDGRPSSGDSAA